MALKIVFMGTPSFGARILEELLREHEVVLVVTQPDRYVGRKKEIVYSPVKSVALKHHIDILQPHKIKEEEDKILAYDFDIIVTAAFGQFVGSRLLNHPKYKAINVHGSLLPKYRGGAPIQRAIMNGEQETGITIMYMAKKMDAGDILMMESLPILDTDTGDSLFLKMADLGAKMILPCLRALIDGTLIPRKQNELEATFAPNLSKEDEQVDFSKTAFEVCNQIRGLCSNPGAYFAIDGSVFKIYSCSTTSLEEEFESGVIVDVTKKTFTISCANKTGIVVSEIKPEGKNTMQVQDFLNGKGKTIIVRNGRVV